MYEALKYDKSVRPSEALQRVINDIRTDKTKSDEIINAVRALNMEKFTKMFSLGSKTTAKKLPMMKKAFDTEENTKQAVLDTYNELFQSKLEKIETKIDKICAGCKYCVKDY